MSQPTKAMCATYVHPIGGLLRQMSELGQVLQSGQLWTWLGGCHTQPDVDCPIDPL